MDSKRYLAYPYNGMLLCFKKEGKPVMWDNLDEPGGRDAEWQEPVIEAQTA